MDPVTVHVCAPVPVNDKLAGTKVSPVPVGVIVTVDDVDIETLREDDATPVASEGYVGNVNVFAAWITTDDVADGVNKSASVPLTT